MSKHWTNDEIAKLWPQTLGELRGFEGHLSVKAGITAAQLSMALQMASAEFDRMSVEPTALTRLRAVAAAAERVANHRVRSDERVVTVALIEDIGSLRVALAELHDLKGG